ncbi:hypothetical protein AAVH_10051 [Aphelenchoides avenae]|nr:hypothetical protein AAVH_10051 [Aphelenchus avenae]
MAQGIGLTDEDRLPWLTELSRLQQQFPRLVLACSSLKRSYRRLLIGDRPVGQCKFLLLDVPKDVLVERVKHRLGHYAKADLIESQLQVLEKPTDASDEPSVIVLNGNQPPDKVLSDAIQSLNVS